MINYDLVKCSSCKKEIQLDQRSIRQRFDWFHSHCFSSYNQFSQDNNIGIVIKTKTLSEWVYCPKFSATHKSDCADFKNEIKSTVKSETYRKQLVPKKIITKKSCTGTDPLLIVLAGGIFSLLIYAAFNIFGNLSIIVIGPAAAMVFYQLLSKRSLGIQYKPKTAFLYPVFILVVPFGFGITMALSDQLTFMTLIQTMFVWSLSLSFWQTMLFVPLAISSVTKEARLLMPDKYPKISIIVPAYNEEKVISTTIESLLATDYPDKEIIVVDDGSSDKTLEIASRYKDKIKLLHKENGGKASALNYAIHFATGKIVTIVDADTIIGNSALKHIAKSMMQDNVAAVAGNIKIRNKVNWITWCQALEYLSGIQIMRRGLDYFGAITIVPGALGAFRINKLHESGAYNKQTLVEDFDLTLKIRRSGMVISGSNDAIAYTQAPQTLRNFYRQRKRWYRGNLQVFRRHSDILLKPRFGYLGTLAYPLMAIHMIAIPIMGLLTWAFAAYQIIAGNYYFMAFTLGIFIAIQYLLSALAVRMDNGDKKMILYSIFLVIGYKQIIDILQIKAIIDEILSQKAKWTSAERVKQ